MKLRMRKPDDFHLHLRNGAMLRAVLPHSMRQFKRAIIMPNTTPPIRDVADLVRYRTEILDAVGTDGFEPLMTFEIVEATMPQSVKRMKKAGAIAGKIYPRSMTTNSEDGVEDYDTIYPVLAEMEQCNMPALFHGEAPDPTVFCLEREAKFLTILHDIARTFPRLKIVMEHVTTSKAVESIALLPDTVAATITAHHLFLTLNDVIGDKLEPHHFCKPVAKRASDRASLLAAATSGNPKFFLGTDSAPHLREKKECMAGCAGVYTAPVAMPFLAELFEGQEKIGRLEAFTSEFGARFYGLPFNQETITLEREAFSVPYEYDGVVPFRAGTSIGWSLG